MFILKYVTKNGKKGTIELKTKSKFRAFNEAERLTDEIGDVIEYTIILKSFCRFYNKIVS